MTATAKSTAVTTHQQEGATIMRKPMWIISGLVVASLIVASPAVAEESHTSCAAVRTVLVPLAQSGGVGEWAAPIAQSGNGAEVNAALRDAYCEPKP